MQTPKSRTKSCGVPQRTSPSSSSPEVSQRNSSPKGTTTSPEASQKPLSRVARRLKSPAASSPNLTDSSPKETSPKVATRKSPRSPLSESKRRPSKLSDVESQISKLEKDLKTLKDQLCSTEALKKQARRDAEESERCLSALSSELQESQKQLLELSASEEVHSIVIRGVFEGKNQEFRSELEHIRNQRSQAVSVLASASSEIEQLKSQLEIAAASAAQQTRHSKSAQADLLTVKEDLAKTRLLVEDMKNQLHNAKESEAQAREIVGETLMQLETAKKTVETLRFDGFKTMEAYDSVASDLDQSRARVVYLEELVRKLKADVSSEDGTRKKESELGMAAEDESIEAEVTSVKVEVERLKLALEVAEARCNEVDIRCKEQIKHVNEMAEQIKSSSAQREAELKMELRKFSYEIEELKANLMDKETELQGICEENEGLNMKLESTLSGQRQHELEKELQRSNTNVETLAARLKTKDIAWQNVSLENEKLKAEIKKITNPKVDDEIMSDPETAAAAEEEALTRIGFMTEEVDKSNKKTARVLEQLEAAQAANAEMETELRRLKVQSNQWRKAAEAAAAILSTGNNGQFMERTGSLDNRYSLQGGMATSPYAADQEDDLIKKNNANMLRRLGVLWKKQQK